MFSPSSFLNDHHLKRFLRMVTANGSYVSAISFLRFTKYCGKSRDLPTKWKEVADVRLWLCRNYVVAHVKWLWAIASNFTLRRLLAVFGILWASWWKMEKKKSNEVANMQAVSPGARVCIEYKQHVVPFADSPPLWICCNGVTRKS